MEGLSDTTKSYLPLSIDDSTVGDETVPPLAKAEMPLKTVLVIYLDKERPLSEPKWVKSGDVQEWLRSMFGRMFWVAGDAAAVGWEKRIEVVDPDPVSRSLYCPCMRNSEPVLPRRLPYGRCSKAGRRTRLSAS